MRSVHFGIYIHSTLLKEDAVSITYIARTGVDSQKYTRTLLRAKPEGI